MSKISLKLRSDAITPAELVNWIKSAEDNPAYKVKSAITGDHALVIVERNKDAEPLFSATFSNSGSVDVVVSSEEWHNFIEPVRVRHSDGQVERAISVKGRLGCGRIAYLDDSSCDLMPLDEQTVIHSVDD